MTVTATVTERTVYHAHCAICLWSRHFWDLDAAIEAKAHHEDWHVASAAVGRRIEGRVFDPNRPDCPFYGNFYFAAEAAIKDGYHYLMWNGRVYEADAKRMVEVCRAKDVPGLVGADS